MTEEDLTKKVSQWMNGIPDDAAFPEDPVFVALIAAKADNYRLALRHGENDALERREAMHLLIGPSTLIALCRAWQDLRHLRRELEWEEEHGLEGAA